MMAAARRLSLGLVVLLEKRIGWAETEYHCKALQPYLILDLDQFVQLLPAMAGFCTVPACFFPIRLNGFLSLAGMN